MLAPTHHPKTFEISSEATPAWHGHIAMVPRRVKTTEFSLTRSPGITALTVASRFTSFWDNNFKNARTGQSSPRQLRRRLDVHAARTSIMLYFYRTTSLRPGR